MPVTELAPTLVRVGLEVSIVTISLGFPNESEGPEELMNVTMVPELKVPKLQPDVHGLPFPLPPPLVVYEIPPLLDVTLKDVALVK